MKITPPKGKRKLILITILVVTALAVMGFIAFSSLNPESTNKTPQPNITTSKTSNEEEVTDNSNPPSPESAKNSPSSNPSPAPTSNENEQLPSVAMRVTSAHQSADSYSIRTLIQYVTSSGNCILTATNGVGDTYTETSGVQALPSSSTCTGFDIPVSTLSQGEWQITITFKNDSVQGSTSTEITVQ